MHHLKFDFNNQYLDGFYASFCLIWVSLPRISSIIRTLFVSWKSKWWHLTFKAQSRTYTKTSFGHHCCISSKIYWLMVTVNSPHKGQWRGALMFSLICASNKRLSKQSWDWWFETPSCPLWRHRNVSMNVWPDVMTNKGISHYWSSEISCRYLLSKHRHYKALLISFLLTGRSY